ncbi:hypothetical protein Vadar_027649 [Vaccinium darrowii]|uniref:Uncharacterized protein n=1 Tax=Vaccinium darrowii TaxID=229202 RepID=A0ACB7Y988_9ERIC|nr:hypothetical protein Vadar_027649 [Vaccinium darrowii]
MNGHSSANISSQSSGESTLALASVAEIVEMDNSFGFCKEGDVSTVLVTASNAVLPPLSRASCTWCWMIGSLLAMTALIPTSCQISLGLAGIGAGLGAGMLDDDMEVAVGNDVTRDRVLGFGLAEKSEEFSPNGVHISVYGCRIYHNGAYSECAITLTITHIGNACCFKTKINPTSSFLFCAISCAISWAISPLFHPPPPRLLLLTSIVRDHPPVKVTLWSPRPLFRRGPLTGAYWGISNNIGHMPYGITMLDPPAPPVAELVRQAGFGGLMDIPFISLDLALITALLERWRPETHSFHLGSGEWTVTLQDVEVILGIPVDGLPVVGSTEQDWDKLCEELLGVIPEAKVSRTGGKLWAWERFPYFAPGRLGKRARPLDAPLGARWNDAFHTPDMATHVLGAYRHFFDLQRPDEVVWRPYDEIIENLPLNCHVGRAIWMAKVPLLCFPYVENHMPDRVMRQFGYRQTIPDDCNCRAKPHGMNFKSGTKDYAVVHANSVALWNDRLNYIVLHGDVDIDVYPADDPYVVWYRKITLRYISRLGAAADIAKEVGIYEGEGLNTQQVIHRALNVASEDNDFLENSAWLSAVREGYLELPEYTDLATVTNLPNLSRVKLVIALVKSCVRNELGSRLLELKDPTGSFWATLHYKACEEGIFPGIYDVGISSARLNAILETTFVAEGPHRRGTGTTSTSTRPPSTRLVSCHPPRGKRHSLGNDPGAKGWGCWPRGGASAEGS